MSDPDPIAQLLADLERHGKPTLGWVVRWSADGRDPVAAAWEASLDPQAMWRLVWPSHTPKPHRYDSNSVAEYSRDGMVSGWSEPDPIITYCRKGVTLTFWRGHLTQASYDGTQRATPPNGWHAWQRGDSTGLIRWLVPHPPTIAEMIDPTRRGGR